MTDIELFLMMLYLFGFICTFIYERREIRLATAYKQSTINTLGFIFGAAWPLFWFMRLILALLTMYINMVEHM